MDRNAMMRHVKFGEKVELENEDGTKDIFTIKPLSHEYMPQYYKLLASFMKKAQKKTFNKEMFIEMDFSEIFSPEDLSIGLELVIASLKQAMPDEDKELVEAFATQNLVMLLSAVISVNMPVGGSEKEIEKKVKEYEQKLGKRKVSQSS